MAGGDEGVDDLLLASAKLVGQAKWIDSRHRVGLAFEEQRLKGRDERTLDSGACERLKTWVEVGHRPEISPRS